MVNRTEWNVAGEIDKLNEADAVAVLSYVSELLSPQKKQSKENLVNDELIGALASAYENQRARQVTEWERMRRMSVQRAA
jgi:hypothetical protein